MAKPQIARLREKVQRYEVVLKAVRRLIRTNRIYSQDAIALIDAVLSGHTARTGGSEKEITG